MDTEEFLKRQIREKHNVFFNELRFRRAVDLKQKQKSYSWEKQGFKIYPSSLKSLTMCPKRFVEEDVHKPPSFGLPAVYKMEFGKAFHSLFQEVATELNELSELVLEDQLELVDKYIRNKYKEEAKSFGKLLWERPRKLSDELEVKMAKAWPEVPIWDEESGISGRADLVLNIQGFPAVLDLKTTSYPKDSWEVQMNKLPSKDHELQVRFYRHFFNKQKYYELPVCMIGLGYINILMEVGSAGSEYEVYKDYGEEPDEEVECLVYNLTEQRQEYMSKGRGKDCKYLLCSAHKESA